MVLQKKATDKLKHFIKKRRSIFKLVRSDVAEPGDFILAKQWQAVCDKAVNK